LAARAGVEEADPPWKDDLQEGIVEPVSLRSTDLGDVTRVEIDGVPVFWVKDDGPCVAGLTFRVGQADENAVTTGITHLVEHLAMSTLGKQQYASNACVTAATTSFFMRGTPTEAAEFVQAVSAALGALPLSRLPLEARILRTEANHSSSSVSQHLLWLRYGNQTYGLPFLRELAFNHPDPAFTQSWANERFNRANCVFWIAGSLPEGLGFPLTDGVRYPLVDAKPIPTLDLPAAMPLKADRVTVGMEGGRTAASTTVFRILGTRLHDQVRLSAGLTYEIGYDRENITTDRAHNAVWLTCLPEQGTAVRVELTRNLESLAVQGPTQQELDDDLDMYVRHTSDPGARVSGAQGAAQYELTGMRPMGPQDLLEERRLVTVEACMEELRHALSTSILVGPDVDLKLPTSFHRYPATSSVVVSGKTFRPVDRPILKRRVNRLIVGETGLSFVSETGEASTVLWSECVAMRVDGPMKRTVLGADGFAVTVDAAHWLRGGGAIQTIDAKVPPWLRVHDPATS
jgi:hypothetical protein